MSRTPLIAGNWKLNTSLAEAGDLAAAIASVPVDGVESVVCPPYPWLVPVAERLAGSAIAVGAQDCWPEPAGAFTGDVSAAMLAPVCRFVLVGHSERRVIHGEEDALVARKLAAVLDAGITPILCVGESARQRAANNADIIVERQLGAALGALSPSQLSSVVVAYEPVWAIGTGTAATADDASIMASLIRRWLARRDPASAASIRVLYGGSVSAGNSAELLAGQDIDGALVGSASLDEEAFNAIRRTAAR